VATSVHPVGAKESRALRRLQRKAKVSSPYVLVSERGAPLSVAGYQRMAARAGGQIGILIRWRALVSRFATKFFSFGQSEERIFCSSFAHNNCGGEMTLFTLLHPSSLRRGSPK
jgi:hypothetical protein